jgi:hypothetical protein
VASQAQAGWSPPDPRRPDVLRYWDGGQWTDYVGLGAPTSRTDQVRKPTGLVSWPAIIVGFFLCLIPGLVLLWLRPTTSKRVKGVVSAAVVGLVVVGAVSEPSAPGGDTTLVQGPVASGRSTTPSPTETPTSSPTATPSDEAAVTPMPDSSEDPSNEPSKKASKNSAIASVEALRVKGRAPKTGYDRSEFGSPWVDVDRNGCDTRNDMLNTELYDQEMANSCKVLAGTLDDPYTGTTIRFEYGGASEVDIDHLVALSDAWQKGATRWPFAKRVALANDPLNLQPTDASANRQKGESDAASWLPPKRSYRCTYVARQAAVKIKYELWVTAAEKEAMLRVLSKCPEQNLPRPGPQPTFATNTGGKAPSATIKPTPKPKPTKSTPAIKLDPQFRTCGEANDAGYGPYYQGQDPEYDWYQDRDRDGAVCES